MYSQALPAADRHATDENAARRRRSRRRSRAAREPMVAGYAFPVAARASSRVSIWQTSMAPTARTGRVARRLNHQHAPIGIVPPHKASTGKGCTEPQEIDAAGDDGRHLGRIGAQRNGEGAHGRTALG